MTSGNSISLLSIGHSGQGQLPATSSKTIDATAIRAHVVELLKRSEDTMIESVDFRSLFRLKTANDWVKDASMRPTPKRLFGDFWFEGEICILFADTNVGKSILGVQIGDSIAGGIPVGEMQLEAPSQKVIYFDFELSDKQFEVRYSESNPYSDSFRNHHVFSANFLRSEIDSDADRGFRPFEEYLFESMVREIERHDVKVLILDNLTFLKSETEKACDALPLMKTLKALKSRLGLSILVLAHTPKRDQTKPLSRNDLAGSKMLINFCDSAMAIGESTRDPRLKYLKHIKARNTEIVYGAENILVCQIVKTARFLHFEFLGCGREWDHLKEPSATDRTRLVEKAKELSKHGKSQREIAEILKVSKMSVSRYLKEAGID